MSALTIDPRQIDWHNRNGLREKAKLNRHGVLVYRARIRSLRDLVVWASGKSNYYISKLLNQELNASAYSFPTTVDYALWTASLTAASTGATAGEASYTGYARVAVVVNTTNFSTSAGGTAITNSVAITFASNGGTLQTVTFVAQLEHGNNNIMRWGSITSTAINPGDTPQMNAAALTVNET